MEPKEKFREKLREYEFRMAEKKRKREKKDEEKIVRTSLIGKEAQEMLSEESLKDVLFDYGKSYFFHSYEGDPCNLGRKTIKRLRGLKIAGRHSFFIPFYNHGLFLGSLDDKDWINFFVSSPDSYRPEVIGPCYNIRHRFYLFGTKVDGVDPEEIGKMFRRLKPGDLTKKVQDFVLGLKVE